MPLFHFTLIARRGSLNILRYLLAPNQLHLEVLERLTCLARFAQIWMHGGVHEDNYMKLYYITNKKGVG